MPLPQPPRSPHKNSSSLAPVPPRPLRSVDKRRLVARRAGLAAAAAATVVVGLAVHFLIVGDLASLVADALYTVLIYLLVGFIFPAARQYWLAVAAFAFSAMIELSQLTGIPQQLAQSFPPSRLLFGTTFSALDLVAYALGAMAVCAADVLASRRAVRARAVVDA